MNKTSTDKKKKSKEKNKKKKDEKKIGGKIAACASELKDNSSDSKRGRLQSLFITNRIFKKKEEIYKLTKHLYSHQKGLFFSV